MTRPQRKTDLSAIFIHAGAGFHSQHNEKAHLGTCENAAKVAMAILKNGGSAVDAVEIAIMVLEDTEITNAGYGSNLTIDGTVECDATIVNHHGQSGAVGAVPQVKNPISLARVILDSSTKPLSLQRVPPNFLVGQGAKDFAYEQSLVVLPHDGLISTAAHERWERWQQDLDAAESRERVQHPMQYQTDCHRAYHRRPLMAHPTRLLSPSPGPRHTSSSPTHDINFIPDDARYGNRSFGITPAVDIRANQVDYSDGPRCKEPPILDHLGNQPAFDTGVTSPRGASMPHNSRTPELVNSQVAGIDSKSDSSATIMQSEEGHSSPHDSDMDHISDTVGAIAVDNRGNIAAGSSSGGIGMKHRGRIGPAALVGVGTTVIPVDPSDPGKTCVATVTSGTGEHIATSMAASTCASRMYYSQRKCADGAFEDVTEEEAMKAMIDYDFMEHPGVRDSHCPGAIGIMTVKKTVQGVILYFGHNTDSFALASMSSDDKKPVSVMSRSSGNGTVALGGRAYRYRRHKMSDMNV